MIFKPSDKERLLLFIDKQFGRQKTLKVEPVTVSKTISQNAYTWLVFTIIGQETGNTKEDVYQFCLNKFPVHKEVEIAGETELIPVSISKMSKEQMSHFIDEFTTFFRSEGYLIPDPEDLRLRDIYNEYKERGLL